MSLEKMKVISEIQQQVMALSGKELPIDQQQPKLPLKEKIKILATMETLEEGFLMVKKSR